MVSIVKEGGQLTQGGLREVQEFWGNPEENNNKDKAFDELENGRKISAGGNVPID